MILNTLKRLLTKKGYTYEGASPLQMLASIGISDDARTAVAAGVNALDAELFTGLRALLASGENDAMALAVLKAAVAALEAQGAKEDEKPKEDEPAPPKDEELKASAGLTREDVGELLGLKAEMQMDRILTASAAPDEVKQAAREYFAGRSVKPTRSEVEHYLKVNTRLLASADDGGHPSDFGRVSVGPQNRDKLQIAMHKLLGSQPRNDAERKEWAQVDSLHSLKEAYVICTGDTHLEAPLKGRNARLQASSGLFQPSDFPYLLGDSMHRAVVDFFTNEQRHYTEYCQYRRGVRDFRDIKINRVKGMGILPKFTDATAGTGLTRRTIPGEEQGTFAVDIFSDKMIFDFKILRNDDISAIEAFVRDYALACVDTVNFHAGAALINATVAFDADGVASITSINTGTVYDGTAMYSVGHGNLMTSAMSYEAIRDAALKIRKQKRPGTDGRNLRLAPYAIWYPISLSATVDTIVDAEREAYSSSNNPNTVSQLRKIMIPEEDLGGSETNWGLIADPKRLAPVQIAFLDDVEAPWITGTTSDQTAGAPWDFLRTEYRGVMMFGVGKQSHEAAVMSIPA